MLLPTPTPRRGARPHLVHASLASVLALALLYGCHRPEAKPPPDDDGPTAKPPVATPYRLTEHLDEASVTSPIAAAPELASRDAIDGRTIFSQDFESARRAAFHWPASAGCSVAARPDGAGRALYYDGKGGHACVFLVAAKPSTYYRVSRGLMSSDPQVDLRLIELRVPVKHPESQNDPDDLARAMGDKFVRMKDLLYVHQWPRLRSQDAWQSDDLYVVTSPFTRAFVVMVHDAEGLLAERERRVWFDDLALEELTPTRAQELALLKRYLPAEGARPARGLHKHGQLLPIGNVSDVSPPYDTNYDHRDALLAVAPSRIVYPLTVPAGASLYFSTGLLKLSHPGDSARFRVEVTPDGEATETLYDESVAIGPQGEGWHWREEKLGLEKFAGKQVRLALVTEAPEESSGLALWGAPIVDTKRDAKARPNVLLIAIDTLRADRLSSYGNPRETSPHLDALAKEGVRFSEATSATNWTSPSFASMFTGLMPSRHQVIHRARAIAPSLSTVTERFADAGFLTQAILYKAYLYNMGFEQGFDAFFNVPRYEVRADDNLEKAERWLEANGDRHFFLFLHFNDPHQPFNQPEEFATRFTPKKTLAALGLKLPIIIEPEGGVQGCARCEADETTRRRFRDAAHELYDSEVRYVDDRIGALLATLRARGLYDDTVIAVVADHGEMMWEHDGYFGHGGAYLYDELTHVPLIIKPARGSGVAPGQVVERQVRTLDLAPTLLELAGVASDPPWEDATSLVPLMRSEPAAPLPPDAAVSENLKHYILSVRQGGWKYVLSHPPGRKPRELLFDLKADPEERRSLVAKDARKLRALRARAAAFLLENRRGRYLVITGDGERRRYRISVKADSPMDNLQSLIGLPLASRQGEREAVFAGESESRLILFAAMRATALDKLTIDIDTVRDSDVEQRVTLGQKSFERFEDGKLRNLLARGEVEAHLFDTAPLESTGALRRTTAADQLETLKALGYVH